MQADIRFLTNEANKVEGLAYAGFETFRGSPYTSCARETGQNSRDAAVGGGPVEVSFDLLELQRDEIPFADQLQHSVECCLAAPQDGKTEAHLKLALETVAAPMIKVLKIADFNTTGLTGPIDDPKSVFTALVKGDGVTNKADPTSAGSFGIGKNAAYAVSDLQTVIYSTRYLDQASSQPRFAAQGRLRLISHTDGDKNLSAEGYWGRKDFRAIEDESDVPSWMARNSVGTSIFAIGFREHDNWADRMTLSLASNFFAAVDRKDIRFSLNGNAIEINQSSIDSILSSENLAQVAEENDQILELKRARLLMKCLRSDATERHTLSVPGLGDFTLHLLIEEGLPREVHIVRNGIYICDNFAKFGQPMKRFPGTREFIALLEPSETKLGEGPSKLLKQLENPAHDAFEPERIIDPAQLKKAKSQIKALISRVREIIKTSAKINDLDRSQLDELSEFFANDAHGAGEADPESERDPERFKYGTARRSRPIRPPATGKSGTAKRRHGSESGEGKGGGNSELTHSRSRLHTVRHTVPLKEVRSYLPDAKNNHQRVIFFTPEEDGDIELGISAAGLGEDVQLQLQGASIGSVSKGRLRTPVRSGQRIQVDVTFAEPFDGPIELWANGIPESIGQAEEEA